MLYVEEVNARMREFLGQGERSVAYGQNIAAGSRLGGLASGLGSVPGCTVINTTNSENTLMGIGMGLALRGVRSCFIMKQLDFAFLGIDHLINSVALLRDQAQPRLSPFVLVTVVVDSGFEGPQASANNLCTLAQFLRVPVFAPSTPRGISAAFAGASNNSVSIVGLSQKMMKHDLLPTDSPLEVAHGWLSYRAESHRSAEHACVCLGFTAPLGFEYQQRQAQSHHVTDVFVSYSWSPTDLARATDLLGSYSSVTIIDDSKTDPSPAVNLAAALAARPESPTTRVVRRIDSEDWLRPSIDGADYEYARAQLSLTHSEGVPDD